MKKCVLMFACAAMLLLGGCAKDGSKGGPGECIYPASWTWSLLVAKYPFLSGFPEYYGTVYNPEYRDLGGLETVAFFSYDCSESVATTYYSSLSGAGFTKSEGSEIYRKKSDGMSYTFSGSYSGGNFALSFSAEKD